MNEGFKGKRIGLNTISISGSVLTYEITYVDAEDRVHGVMRHSRPVEDDPDVRELIHRLSDLLISQAASTHFENPGTEGLVVPTSTPPTRVRNDILTTINEPRSRTSEEPDSAQG